MSNDEDTVLLLGLGLSVNQARVYLAILKLQKTTVGQAAKFSKVRREDIYRALPTLEKKAILAKTSGLIRNSKKEVALIADKARIMLILSQFSDECKQAIKNGAQVRLIFEGDSTDIVLKEKVQKLIGNASVHIKFHCKPLNHFIMLDDAEALITGSAESGLGESPSLWTNNSNLIGVLRTGFESGWKKAEN